MSKASTVTVRKGPLSDVASSAAAGLKILAGTITVETGRRLELTDLTEQVADRVRASGVREGTVSVWSLHTTCALMINEFQKALLADITRLLEELVARDGPWSHNDPGQSDCDRMNADAHLRAMLLGQSLAL